jgi:cytochrome c oxidase subunit 2
MEIHRFESVWILVSILLILGFIGTVTYGAVGIGIQMVDESGGTIDDPTNPTASEAFRDPGVYQTGQNQYDVYIIAQQFLFTPGTSQPIQLPANSRVTFHITSTDVIHGFDVSGTNLNVMVIPGQIATITADFEDPATYGIVCNEYCGAAHHSMEGRLEVVPQAEFEGGSQ